MGMLRPLEILDPDSIGELIRSRQLREVEVLPPLVCRLGPQALRKCAEGLRTFPKLDFIYPHG